ncbi:uncharacterized protein METZ01_LOCUS404931 [marine metagenome]|uniref:Uncharacterized protein n=1 Tax=marine metagenome TaxID=408172 RepID=A0A382VZX8_9ZZZZ
MIRSEENNIASSTSLLKLLEELSSLRDQMRQEHNLIDSLANSQIELRPVLEQLANNMVQENAVLDESTQTHIRNIEVYLARLLEELSAGRNDLLQQISSEIKLLARTIAAGSRDTD